MLRRLLPLAIVCAWLVGCGWQSGGPNPPMPAGGSGISGAPSPNGNVNELPEPPVVKSVNGVARVSLLVTQSPATGFPQFVFDGNNDVAPTIRVNPGDRIVINLDDELSRIRGDSHDINLHFHGLGTSPQAPSDDVLGMLARPGQRLHYDVLVPKNQEPGLYWYHPHVHGQTTYQVGDGGMSGAIVVNGLEHHLPGLARMKERLMIVRATGIGPNAIRQGVADDGMGMSMDSPVVKPQLNSQPCGPSLGLTTTLNGAYRPVITIAPGEKQFFRLVNAMGHNTLKLTVDGGKLEVVAIDGFALDTYPGTPPTLTETTAIVPPAARLEFVVTGQSSRTKFRSLCYDSGVAGDRDPEVDLATLQPPKHGQSRQTVTAGPLRVGAPLPQNVYTENLPPVAAKRVVVFSEGPKRFLINNKGFSMSDPPMYVVRTGTVEKWRIVNVSQEIHDFHIHQVHFLVEQINGVKLEHPFWADSTVIPHRQKNGKPGTLVLLMDFRDPTIKGTFLFHCHILDHEDAGMMAKIQAI